MLPSFAQPIALADGVLKSAATATALCRLQSICENHCNRNMLPSFAQPIALPDGILKSVATATILCRLHPRCESNLTFGLASAPPSRRVSEVGQFMFYIEEEASKEEDDCLPHLKKVTAKNNDVCSFDTIFPMELDGEYWNFDGRQRKWVPEIESEKAASNSKGCSR
jgi:hypothetical protein